MERDELMLFWLSTKLNLNPERYMIIFDVYESLEAAVNDSFGKLKDEKWAKKFVAPVDLNLELQKYYDLLEFHKIKVISYWSVLYPERLKVLGNDAPIVLYYQGDIELLVETNMITVVGSRDIGNYSKIIIL